MARFQGYIFRAIRPRFAYEPLSMKGSSIAGGRYNHVGTLMLYTSTDPITCVAEIQNGLIQFEPKTIVSYYADINNIIDLTTPAKCVAEGVDFYDLSCDWRFLAGLGQPVPSRIVADDLIAKGAYGIKVPSYAKVHPKNATNLVIWNFDAFRPNQVLPYDLQKDLPKNDDSWK